MTRVLVTGGFPMFSVGYCKALGGAWVDTIKTIRVGCRFMHSVDYKNVHDSTLTFTYKGSANIARLSSVKQPVMVSHSKAMSCGRRILVPRGVLRVKR